MNDVLKVFAALFALLGLYIFGHYLFDWIFTLDNRYLSNSVGWPTFFSFLFVFVVVLTVRVVSGKLRIKLVWE